MTARHDKATKECACLRLHKMALCIGGTCPNAKQRKTLWRKKP